MKVARSGWRARLASIRESAGSWKGTYDIRSYWFEKAFRHYAGEPAPVQWAHAFAGVLEHMELHTFQDDVIPGSRLGFLATCLPEGEDEHGFAAVVEAGKSRRRRDFGAGWDHTLADYPTLLSEGIDGLQARIDGSARVHTSPAEQATLQGMRTALEGFSRFIRRHAALATSPDARERMEWISRQPPRTFHEAIQLVWLTQLAFASGWRYANALGRIDQYLWRFYEADLAAGRLDHEGAMDLLCSLWARVHELGEVTNICVGGLRPDGQDGTNALSYLCIEATRLVKSPHTNLSARFHDDTPDDFHRAAFECIRTGLGFPAIFNDHVLIPGLEEIGIPVEIARDHCMVGCIETMLAGRQQAWSDSRFNAPGVMLAALRRLAAGPVQDWTRLQALFEAEFGDRIASHVDMVNAHIASFPVAEFPDPFLSALTHDCIGRARDLNAGGAQFRRFHGIAVMGLANVADGLAAIRKLVLEDGKVALADVVKALDSDFDGFEPLRQLLLNGAPKYGNGDAYVDDIAAWVVKISAETCLRHHTIDGGRFIAAMAANVSNIAAGRETGATPDGRRARTPLSDAASPFFGRDVNGPTAFLRSVAVPDYRRILTGSVINMKFEPEYFTGEEGVQRFGALTRFFVRNRIPELQFNFTGTKVLLEARRNPREYHDLVVRVSGFSSYFVWLDPAVQDDIIRRRGHGAA